MAAPRPDRRIERTRSALMQAFVGLLLGNDLEAITVAAVVARANVGRSTFYSHFRGRDDILKASLDFPSRPLARVVTEFAEPAELLPLLAHFGRQRRLARTFHQGALRRVWVRCLADLIERGLVPLTRRLKSQPLLPIPLVSAQLAELQIALVLHWLASREPLSLEAVAEALVAVSRAMLASLLQCKAADLQLPLQPRPAGPRPQRGLTSMK